MKAKWFDEVAVILQSDQFHTWLERLERSRKTLRLLRERHEEVLTQVNLLEFRAEIAHRKAIDTLERANHLDDESIGLSNESAEIENASFEEVSQFEAQRAKCTKLWETLGAVDMQIDEAKGGGDVARLTRQREKLATEYEREAERKQELWVEVEALWVRSIDRSLALHEKRHKAKVVRSEAETYFQQQSSESKQAEVLREEASTLAEQLAGAEAEVTTCCAEARENYECLLHEDFLYWSAREDNKLVYATPLLHDTTNYAVELRPGAVYQCPHQRGLDELVELELEDEEDAGEAGDDGDAEASTEPTSTDENESDAQEQGHALDAFGEAGGEFSVPLEERPTRLLDVSEAQSEQSADAEHGAISTDEATPAEGSTDEDGATADSEENEDDSDDDAAPDETAASDESDAETGADDEVSEENATSRDASESQDDPDADAVAEADASETETSSEATSEDEEEDEPHAPDDEPTSAEEPPLDASADKEDETADSGENQEMEGDASAASEDAAPEEASGSEQDGEEAEEESKAESESESSSQQGESSASDSSSESDENDADEDAAESPPAAEETSETSANDSSSTADAESEDESASAADETTNNDAAEKDTADSDGTSGRSSGRSRKNKLRGGRRRGKRHRRTKLEIRTELIFSDKTIFTTTQNIAAGGISFQWEDRVEVGEKLEARCYIPMEDSFDPIKIQSEVVWVDPVGDDWKVGIAFREFAADDEDLLKKWLLERIRAEKVSA